MSTFSYSSSSPASIVRRGRPAGGATPEARKRLSEKTRLFCEDHQHLAGKLLWWTAAQRMTIGNLIDGESPNMIVAVEYIQTLVVPKNCPFVFLCDVTLEGFQTGSRLSPGGRWRPFIFREGYSVFLIGEQRMLWYWRVEEGERTIDALDRQADWVEFTTSTPPSDPPLSDTL